MLLNFKMENFRSFKDETFFTMLSSKQKTHNDYVIDKSVNGNKLRVLPMTVIYGANACGKSNIVLAMDILKKMVNERNLKLQKSWNLIKVCYLLLEIQVGMIRFL